MMNDMMERVARAIDPERWAQIDHMPVADRARPVLIAAEKMRASAAIEAMREPTEAMTKAAERVEVRGADLHDFAAFDCAPDVWKAMIDAALKDT
jgi:hypothetical protein